MKLGGWLVKGLRNPRPTRKRTGRRAKRLQHRKFFLRSEADEKESEKSFGGIGDPGSEVGTASASAIPHPASTLAATPPAVISAEVEVLPVELPRPLNLIAPPGLRAEEFIRPDSRLRQSIEAFLLDQRSPHTRRAYGKDLERFLKYLIVRNGRRNTEQGPEHLNRAVLIGYKDFLLAEKLEHTTVDRHLATLRSFFRWLVDDGIIEKNPAEGVRFLNPKRLSRTNAFTDLEVVKLLKGPNLHTRTGSQHYAMLMILFYCGLRRSELCDLKNASLGEERSHHVLRLRGKGNTERMIVLIPAVWSALQHYFMITKKDLARGEFLFSPIRNNRTGVKDKAIDPSMIFYIVTKYAKMAGVANRVSPHSCRATAISNARDHQVPDRAIQEFAGWASPDMITRYDKRKNSVENSAARAIEYGEPNRPLPSLAIRPDSDEGREGDS
ncbi:MAG: tyrosine-type recombinase/integrase [Cryobacterium sp.]|nr:tyrosine-type recombinase/integrase [Oligoflexia bacterium]